MLQRFSIAYVYLTFAILFTTFVAFKATLAMSNSMVYAFTVSAFLLSNLILFAILVNVWLIDRSPALKHLLEKLPGISFAVPIPAKLRSFEAINKASDTRFVQKRSSEFSKSKNELVEHTESNQPFTLATYVFEPPEPIGKAASTEPTVPVLDSVVSKQVLARGVEGAFHKSKRQSEKTQHQLLLEQFYKVCQSLKRINQEVAVWTERELATLANSMLTPDSDINDMISILLPQRVLRINSQRTFEFEHHATLLNNVLLATGERLAVTFINSSKDESSGQCIVNFEHNDKPVTWRFTESTNHLSEKFLNTALKWVARQANGQFHLLADENFRKSYVFVSAEVEQALFEQQNKALH